MKIIGREKEKEQLKHYYESSKPEFLAVYGRRRVGKTFLIRELLGEHFAFHMTGVANKNKKTQLDYFARAMRSYGVLGQTAPSSWPDAFECLISYLTKLDNNRKKILFFDEISWLDSHRSGFLSALEHFWNDWASTRPDILLIICGSATSWIVDNLLNNRDGLFDRITKRMELLPFTLAECEEYFVDNMIAYDRRQMMESYMIFGGIPFYMSLMETGKSIAQNTDNLCFARNALLKNEFSELYATIFRHPDHHIEIVKALAKKQSGLTRDDLIQATKIPSGGSLSKALSELESSGFIYRYSDYTGAPGRCLYHLVDPFSLFYLKFMLPGSKSENNPVYWSQFTGSGEYFNWAGHAFERLCLLHSDQIKNALGISGIMTNIYSWRSAKGKSGAQIDLVIDRADGIINLCDMKYDSDVYHMDAADETKLRTSVNVFREETKTKKALHPVLVTPFGIAAGIHSAIIQAQVKGVDLFRPLWQSTI